MVVELFIAWEFSTAAWDPHRQGAMKGLEIDVSELGWAFGALELRKHDWGNPYTRSPPSSTSGPKPEDVGFGIWGLLYSEIRSQDCGLGF